MIYTPLTKKAMKLAYEAHHGQVDKAGLPYIFHPIHLAEQMDDELSCCAALLHDTVEDTDVTQEEILRLFGKDVAEVIALLTHRKDEDYFEYVRAIAKNPVAKRVKLADLDHNSDQSRCDGAELSEEKLAYWREKYQKAREILLNE